MQAAPQIFLLLRISAVPRCHHPCGDLEGADSMGSAQRDDLSCSPLGFPPASTGDSASPPPPPQGSAWSWWGELALGGCQLSSLQRQMTAAAFGGPDASANLVVTNVAVTHPGVEMTAAYFPGAAVGTGWWYSFLSHPIPPSWEVEDAKAI